MNYYFAQKFTTTGVSGGVKIQMAQDNPGTSKSNVPGVIRMSLFQWDTDYAITVAGTALVIDDAIVPSQETEEDFSWAYLFWKPLDAGTYLWVIHLEIMFWYDAFQVRIDTGSTYHDAFVEGASQIFDFYSRILGLDPETHEKVMSLGDTFDGAYTTDGGHSGTKINKGSVGTPNYVNSIRAQDAVVKSGQKAGRIASGSLVKVN